MIRNFYECFETLDSADHLHAVGNVDLAESDIVL